ncbi:hypothetical protein EVAR_87335_1 [Eumeta japonica]|uniref:Uncharacterized protein n=1 Tax=Eumeta variegata TaxID=151549 RepID=A0A4C1YVJ3_EUMVA|nr:hypothetical protein EVAR_87335_1 [Eumeta japonica]
MEELLRKRLPCINPSTLVELARGWCATPSGSLAFWSRAQKQRPCLSRPDPDITAGFIVFHDLFKFMPPKATIIKRLKLAKVTSALPPRRRAPAPPRLRRAAAPARPRRRRAAIR